METPSAPKHLSQKAKEIWKQILDVYVFEDRASLEVLTAALESYDRAKKYRKKIDKDGPTLPDRAGGVKIHPLVPAEAINRAAFLKGIKDLNLDLEPATTRGRGRPPRR